MDNLEKIFIPVIVFVITSIVAYLFRMRQLYVCVPKLYKESAISKNGSLCEIIIYNRGNQVEEDIKISLDQNLKTELLAASRHDVALINSVLTVERLHKGEEVSAILLAEEGILNNEKIVLASSKGAKAKLIKNAGDVPYNAAKSFVSAVLLISMFPMIFYSFKLYEKYQVFRTEENLSFLYEKGWSGLNHYYSSEIRASYSNKEFPERFISKNINDKKMKYK